MTLEEAKRFAEYEIQNLYDDMVPNTINSHPVMRNLDVEPKDGSIVVRMNLMFKPTGLVHYGKIPDDSDYSFSYAEMIPLDYLNTSDGKIRYKTQWREYVKRLVIDITRAIIDMDKRYPPDIQPLSSPLYENVIAVETLKTIMSGIENGTFKEEEDEDVIRSSDDSDERGEEGNEA
ncbi:MAG: hypothetical protein J6U54_10215 [Clostridiales bacterium]|nr:hypothetical protein [Clostridiales bacterium]